jgi:DNA-binding beta-propeller fold protein YncE
MKKAILLFVCIAALLSSTVLNAQTKSHQYRIAKTIHLQGDGGWDYLAVDEVNSRLFVSHSTQVNVVDLKNGEQIAIVPDTKGVHGIAIANDLNKAFISNGKDSSVTVVGLQKFDLITKISITGKNPDAILYDPFTHRVFTFNGRSSNATVIDAKENKQIGTIPLSGKPEFAQTDGKGNIYVNIEDKSSISIIDAVNLKVLKTWSIAPGEEPSGLALDNINHRLFSVCGNKLMIVSDAVTGKVITSVTIGDRCDGVAFDPASKRIFSSNGEGTITVIQQESADTYKVVETFATQASARTIAIDKTTHHLYVSAGEYEPGEGRRPVKPGTFVVLDIEPVK